MTRRPETFLSQDLAVERALFGRARVARAPMWDTGWRQHLADVESGLVTSDQAERDYGVVIAAGCVDEEATAARRTRRPALSAELVDVGPERRAYEEVWTDELVTEMLRLLAVYPTRLRPIVRNRVRHWVEQQGRPVRPRELALAVDEVAARMGLERPPVATGAAR